MRILHHFYLIKEINLSNKPTLFLIDGKLVFDLFFDVIGCCEGLELFGEWTLPRRETLRKNMRESFYNGVLSQILWGFCFGGWVAIDDEDIIGKDIVLGFIASHCAKDLMLEKSSSKGSILKCKQVLAMIP